MSDNRRVYRRIKQGLLQLYPKQIVVAAGDEIQHRVGFSAAVIRWRGFVPT